MGASASIIVAPHNMPSKTMMSLQALRKVYEVDDFWATHTERSD